MRPANKNIAANYFRPFFATAMVAGGLIQFATPLHAEGTLAGTDISNTATASYEDANTGTSANTISNTVSVKVEKIAGITVTADTVTDVTEAGKYKPGDTVNFDFKVTNKGNSAVKFSLPDSATVTAAGTVQKLQWFNPTTNAWEDITANFTTPSAVAADAFVKVRVIVTVNNVTVGDPLTVQLGNTLTAPTEITPTSNVDRDTSTSGDVYTVDITDGSGGVPTGAAVNGVKEAAALQTVNVQKDKQAFANISMTSPGPVPNPSAPLDVTQNTITYNISVKVEPNAPAGSDKTASDLGATPIKLDSGSGVTTVNKVLIADPLPTGTVPTTLTAPTGWTPVYSTSPLNTPQANIEWKTGTPPTDGSVKFVGFVKNDDQPLAMNTTPYSGFIVEVKTTGASTTAPTTFNNTADVYGTTPNGSVADPTKPVHDQTGTAAVNTGTGGTPVTATISPATLTVLNGPKDQPAAIGPDTTTDTDFTNQSAAILATDATVTDPVTGALTPLVSTKVVNFQNTVKNTSTVATDIYLLPTVPTVADSIPNGTTVKLTYDGNSRTYTYAVTGTGASSVGSYTVAETSQKPLAVAAVAAGATNVYDVSVTLPAGTPQLTGYGVPITAFANTTAPANGAVTVPTATTVAKNTTIDTVYTGFIDLKKDARILDTVADAGADEATKPYSRGTLTVKPKPGQFIQYRVKYNNISTGGGTNNIELKAKNLKIVEDGTLSSNSWGTTTNHQTGKAIDSKGGTINYFEGATTKTDNDTTVNKYIVDMGTTIQLAPGESGNFTFLREIK